MPIAMRAIVAASCQAPRLPCSCAPFTTVRPALRQPVLRPSSWSDGAQAASRRQRSLAAAAAASGGEEQGSEAAAGEEPQPGVPPAWAKAQRISGDAMAMMGAGEALTSQLILEKGIAELDAEFPGDPSTALLCTQLWNIQQESGQYAEALQQAQKAYDLMVAHFGPDSADAAFHGIRLGISLVVGGGDLGRAQELLIVGGNAAQHNLTAFWTRLQELEASGQDTADLTLSTRKLMVALAECNFYGAIGIVRKAIENADDLELPMQDLEEAWLGGTKQLAMALQPEHPMFDTALRELGRLVPDAAGRPALQAELEAVLQKLKEMVYLLRNLPDSMKAQALQEGGAEGQLGGQQEDEYLP